jgi:hypothetical protein
MPAELTLIEGPAAEAIALTEAKNYCGIWQDVDDHDAYVETLISAAREFLEKRTGRAVGVQTWREWRTVPASGVVRLMKAPIVEVTTVEVDGLERTYLLKPGNRLEVGTGSEVVVTYRAGWETIPRTARLAMLALIIHWFDNRVAVSEKAMLPTPLHYEALEAALSWGAEMPSR